jgi:glycosyltransferase involved in cell wall biosynthesis
MPCLIALLGRRDTPTDGVSDYCESLSRALSKHGVEMQTARVSWDKLGWFRALWDLFRESRKWRGQRVALQYTAMAWSRRGFPVGALVSLVILKIRGARCALMFHEPYAISGPGRIDGVRVAFQNWTLRTLHSFSQKSIFTVPLHTVFWLHSNDAHSKFIPLGPNIPENLARRSATNNHNGGRKTVVVFCLSEAPYHQREVSDVSFAARSASAEGINLRVVFVGRGASEAKNEIDSAFHGTQIEVCNRGLCAPEEVTRIFAESDAMLAVRGRLYLRRGSALAGLACGLPIIGYAGWADGTIIEEAGVTLVPFGDQQALSLALRNVLTNPDLWQEMHEKSLRAQEKYFSWDVIARSYVDFFSGHPA